MKYLVTTLAALLILLSQSISRPAPLTDAQLAQIEFGVKPEQFSSPIFLEMKSLKTFGQDENHIGEKHQCSHIQSLDASEIIRRSYDVIRYELFLDWYAPLAAESVSLLTRRFMAQQIITVIIDSADVKKLVFNADDLRLISISVDGVPIEEVPQPSKEEFAVPGEFSQGDTVEIAIEYRYIGNTNTGFHLYNGKAEEEAGLRRVAFTQSEPEDARRWMPCNDMPYDKATTTKVSIRVPKNMTALSNGLLSDVVTDDSSSTYIWENRHPIATYLMNAIASEYDYVEETVEQIYAETPVPVRYHFWHGDDVNEYKATTTYTQAHRAFPALMKYFGDYPFDKYYAAPADPYPVGGMEHQGNMTFKRDWLKNNSYNGFSHELAHHWLGNLVTCATWKDIWLNEGGATFSEALALDEYGYILHLLSLRSWLFHPNNVNAILTYPIYGNKPSEIFGVAYPVSYWKAGWVLHMLRNLVGDEVFFGAFQRIFDEYAYDSYETKDFIRIFKEEAPETEIDLDIFFEQWLMHAGYPIYDVTYSIHKDGERYRTDVTLEQVQDKDPYAEGNDWVEVYESQLAMFIAESDDPDNGKYIEILNNQKVQSYSFFTDSEPIDVVLSARYTLLQIGEVLVSVKDASKAGFSVYPNPVEKGKSLVLSVNINAQNDYRLELFDFLGRRVLSKDFGNLPTERHSLALALGNIESGGYVLTLSSGQSIILTEKVLVK